MRPVTNSDLRARLAELSEALSRAAATLQLAKLGLSDNPAALEREVQIMRELRAKYS